MTVGATRYFESSFSTIEWMLEERQEQLTDDQIDALIETHETLREVSNEIWGVEPPMLPEKTGSVPLHDEYDEEWFRENF